MHATISYRNEFIQKRLSGSSVLILNLFFPLFSTRFLLLQFKDHSHEGMKIFSRFPVKINRADFFLFRGIFFNVYFELSSDHPCT